MILHVGKGWGAVGDRQYAFDTLEDLVACVEALMDQAGYGEREPDAMIKLDRPSPQSPEEWIKSFGRTDIWIDDGPGAWRGIHSAAAAQGEARRTEAFVGAVREAASSVRK